MEVLFGDGKELLGLDQYQVMSAEAIVRFWTLAWAAYCFLDEERARLGCHGSAMSRWGRRAARCSGRIGT